MKNALSVAVALTLAGCSATPKAASFDAPRVTAPGTSPISPGMQLAFCQDHVADMYGAKRPNATTENAWSRRMAVQQSTSLLIRAVRGQELQMPPGRKQSLYRRGGDQDAAL